MTTYFESPKPLLKIEDSPYRDQLEHIAPNICVLIESSATIDENWPETLARVLPTINSTPAQDGALMALAVRAASGDMPVGYVPPPDDSIVAPKMTVEKFLTYAGVAGVLYKLFS